MKEMSVNRIRVAVLALTIGAALALCILMGANAKAAERTVNVPCGADIDSTINTDPVGTGTRFVLGSCDYVASTTVKPENGDEIFGPEGTFIRRDTAYDPEGIKGVIVGASGLDQVIKPQGHFYGRWFGVEGGDFDGSAGSGVGIAGGQMAESSGLYAVRVANNEGAGISNFHGYFFRSEATNNTTDPDALGFIGSAIKAVDEIWVVESYIHDTQGNGVWGDEEANDTSTTCNTAGNCSFYVNSNLIVNAGRDGVRWEKVGDEASHGEAIIENNELHGNGRAMNRAGVGVRDAQDAIIRDNNFGAATIAGISYGRNGYAWSATDSGRADRPNLYNIDILNNARNGDAEKGCSAPDPVVVCTGNTP